MQNSNTHIPQAVDLLMLVGDEYTVPAYIRESQAAGVSKRIPATAIPQGIVPGISRLFLWHMKVIPVVGVDGLSMFDLVTGLINMAKLTVDEAKTFELNDPWKPDDLPLLPYSYVPQHILRLTCIIQDLPARQRKQFEDDFKIEWQPAVFSWCHLGKVQYVLPNDASEADIPDAVMAMADEVDFVKVEYVE